MIRFLKFGCVAVATLAAGIANAADMPVRPITKAPIMAPAPIYNWSGFYIGGHLGGVWGDVSGTNVIGNALQGAGAVTTATPNGFLGGGQIGINWQMNSWVLGLEFDGSATDFGASANAPGIPAGFTLGAVSKAKAFFLGTGRLGWAVNNMLLYVKGGGAWMDVRYTSNLAGLAQGTFSVSDTRSGWTVGGGVEMGFAPNWSGKLEYNYMDFGTTRYNFTLLGNTGPADIKATAHAFKAGINYHFGWGG